MQKEILEYLKTQRIGVLAVEMLDGSPHGATVHFANNENSFFFETSEGYRKTEPILKNKKTRATFVVGCNEGDMKTLQLDGEVEMLDDNNEDIFKEVYFGKFPEKLNKNYGGAKQVHFSFTPKWWRFTDWTTPEGKKILLSN